MTDETRAAAAAKLLREWWSFNEYQQHTHSWHAREDFIERELPKLLANPPRLADERDCYDVAGQIADAVQCYEGDDLLGQITPHLKPLIGELEHLRKSLANPPRELRPLVWVEKCVGEVTVYYEANSPFVQYRIFKDEIFIRQANLGGAWVRVGPCEGFENGMAECEEDYRKKVDELYL